MGIHPRLRRGMTAVGLACAMGAVSLLSACDSGPSPLPARDRQASAAGDSDRADKPYETRSSDTRQAEADVPTIDGKPIWAANRKHTAQENAQYQFDHHGSDFGAKSVDAFVSKAHDFVTDPPSGVATIKRANGDRLLYDAKANIFAVVTKDGAPRTIFKPDDGPAYWDKQKDREAQYASKSKKGDDDQG